MEWRADSELRKLREQLEKRSWPLRSPPAPLPRAELRFYRREILRTSGPSIAEKSIRPIDTQTGSFN
jgi:hypothetical protein